MKAVGFDHYLRQLRRAADKGIDNMRRLSGETTDSDLMIYNKLNPEEMREIYDSYGPENFIEYVREMEYRRLRGGG